MNANHNISLASQISMCQLLDVWRMILQLSVNFALFHVFLFLFLCYQFMHGS
jgi:hypothetical protein